LKLNGARRARSVLRQVVDGVTPFLRIRALQLLRERGDVGVDADRRVQRQRARESGDASPGHDAS
jgi:hypothetical protein